MSPQVTYKNISTDFVSIIAVMTFALIFLFLSILHFLPFNNRLLSSEGGSALTQQYAGM